MTTYAVTLANWNDPAFWAGINETGAGHTLDFSALPSSYSINYDPDFNFFTVSDGTTPFTVGDSGYGGGADAALGGSTLFTFFTNVIGTDGNDFIYGGVASETLTGGAGDDTLLGFSGDDSISGGAGDDLIQGQGGNDTVDGGDGSDTIEASAGSDSDVAIGGESAGDRDVLDLIGSTGAFVTFSGNEAGTYTMGAASGTFSQFEDLRGSDGNDTINAAATNSGMILGGGAGNDSITGGTGADSIDGGAGDDSIYVQDGFGADTIEGGTQIGEDDLRFTALTSGIDVSFTVDFGGTATQGADTLTFSGIEDIDATNFNDTLDASLTTLGIELDGFSGDDTLIGGSGGDNLDGDQGADSIFGGAGDDTVWIDDGFGADTLDGGTQSLEDDLNFQPMSVGINVTFGGADFGTATDGVDTLIFSGFEDFNLTQHDDTVDGSLATQNMELDGFQGNDSLRSGSGNDDIEGHEGSDTLSGGAGADSLRGQADADTFIIEDGFGADTIVGGEGVTTGTDTDTVDFSAMTTSISVTYSGNEAGSATDGSDAITFSEVEAFVLTAQADSIDGALTTSGINLDGGAGNDTIAGGTGSDSLTGGDGFDRLLGGTGNDTLEGGTGADRFYGGAGDDLMIGGADGTWDNFYLEDGHGNDTITEADNMGTITTRAGTDTGGVTGDVTATFGASFTGTFSSSGGTVTFSGIGSIVTGDGNDFLDASAMTSDVYLTAGNGQNTVFGGSGTDDIRGGSGNDSLVGNDGNDYFEARGGNDTVIGGAGNDILDTYASGVPGSITYFDAGTGNDSLIGRGNVDIANMGSGDDYVFASGGDDTINAGGGADTIETGDDADLIQIEAGFGGTTVTGGEGVTTGTDTDVLDFSNLTVDLDGRATGGERGYFEVGTDRLDFSEIEEIILGQGNDQQAFGINSTVGLTVDGQGGNDTLLGSNFGDNYLGGTGNDLIFGNDGDDTISGGDGDDSIVGGRGNDLLTTGLGNDTLEGGEGNDTLMNSDGDDSLDGGAGDDSIVATGGQDTLRGGTGADTMEGGDDADTFIIEDGFGNDVITGGEGTTDPTDADFDTIDLSAMTGPVTVTYTGDEAGTITDGTDTITFSEIERIILTDQNDSVDASVVFNGVFGDNPGINVDAAGGNDTVLGSWGADTINAGTGNDSIDADYGDDSVDGGSGLDTLIGGSGNDTLLGGADADFIDGGIEADTLDGGAGNDTILGGAGNDQISGGEGNDSVSAGDGDDIIGGWQGDDTLQGDAGNDSIEGGAGADSIVGGSGDDLLVGYDADGLASGSTNVASDDGSADTIDGGTGNDTLAGGAGNDSLTGGDGDDTFVYNAGDGNDTITDFNTGNTGTLDDGDSTNNDYINLSGYYDHISELYADQADDGILNQSNTTDTRGNTTDYSDNTQFSGGEGITFSGASADESSFTAENTGVVCFTSGTLILTAKGEVPVEMLRPGDVIVTRDNGPQTLLWSGMRRLGAAELAAAPHLRPVEIAAGFGGNDRPLIVSPQHGILLRLDGEDVLARAIHLARLKGGAVRQRMGCRRVTYWHLFFERHQIIFSNGRASESYYPGPQAIAGLSTDTRRAFADLLPEIDQIADLPAARSIYGDPARHYSRTRMLPEHVRAFAPSA